MAQLSPMQRHSHQSPKTPQAQTSPMQRYSDHQSPKTTPTAQTSPTFEQLLHGGNLQTRYSDLSNSSPISGKNLDIEEDFTPHGSNKKSVLSKWREKVKKIRHNIKAKKMHQYPYYYYGNTTPSWGVTLDDEDEEADEDPEYLGAPMYESELAPESCKETARQHPRAEPVVPEKHAVPNMVTKHKPEKDDKNTPHSKTITETVSEKLAPAYAAVSDVTHTIASSIVNLKISSSSSSNPKDQVNHKDIIPVSPSSAGALPLHSKQQSLNEKQQNPVLRRDQSIKSPGESDKGVSVKEYVMHKLEPGDDEKALSKVVCDALSPTKKPQGENSNFTGGVVGKVREVVTSLLRDIEEPSHGGVQSKKTNMNNNLSTDIQKVSANPNVSLKHAISAPSTNLPPCTANSSSPIPVSTNPHQVTIVAEEENLGRILQAN